MGKSIIIDINYGKPFNLKCIINKEWETNKHINNWSWVFPFFISNNLC